MAELPDCLDEAPVRLHCLDEAVGSVAVAVVQRVKPGHQFVKDGEGRLDEGALSGRCFEDGGIDGLSERKSGLILISPPVQASPQARLTISSARLSVRGAID